MEIYLRGIWVWFNSFAYATSNRGVLTGHYKNSWGDSVEIRVYDDRVLFYHFKNHTIPFLYNIVLGAIVSNEFNNKNFY
jgi:hypothetical protein